MLNFAERDSAPPITLKATFLSKSEVQGASVIRGGELGVLRVREHPLSEKVHPLIAKSTLSKQKKNVTKHHLKAISNKDKVIKT